MKENITNEFSFVLKPSKFGIGVFVTHNIKKGIFLRLFGNETPSKHLVRTIDKEEVPKLFQGYCIDRGNKLVCPLDFGSMSVGWYLNHSNTPNAIHKNYSWYALRDIREGEEIVIDYNSIEEPEESKKGFYKPK